MQDDSHTPSDEQFQRPSSPGANPGNNPPEGRTGGAARRNVPVPLQNWQVLEPATDEMDAGKTVRGEAVDLGAGSVVEIEGEIEGEATLVDAPTPDAAAHAATSATIADRQDRLIGLGLDARRYGVEPGEAATLNVDLLNNGPSPALFEVNLEGWIDETWTPELPVRVHLPPGERRSISITLTLPRGSATQAGEYAFAVTAQTARYAGHVARVGAVLAIARHTAFQLGSPQPRRIQTSWFRRSAVVHVPLYNQSNHAVRFALRGFAPSKSAQSAHFTYYPPQQASRFIEELDDAAMDGIGRQGEGIIHAEPGASLVVPVRIEPADRPWIGLFPQVTSYRLVAWLVDEPARRRTVEGQIGLSPLIGPWQMGIAALLALVAIVGMGLTGLALLLALRSPAPVPAAVSHVAVTPAPPAVFVIQLAQPAPTRAPDGALPALQAPPAAGAAGQSAQPQGSDGAFSVPIAPVVRADQVTAPGEPTPAGLTPLQPLGGAGTEGTGANAVVVATPTAVVIGAPAAAQPAPAESRSSAPGGMTYGEMFREIGLRYDWDWRLLAAQAYIESGFDSLALSNQGDMGLMQIRPPTWQEWAPQVAASDPFDSYSNVLVAARYLDYLRTLLSERGYPQQEWTLVAYNWGPDEVLDYLAAGGTWESLDAGLRRYAEDIQRISQTIPAD